MIISIIITTVIAFGGMCLTYVFSNSDRLMTRIAKGVVIGSAVFGTVIFLMSFLFGLSIAAGIVSLVFVLSPAVILAFDPYRKKMRLDLRHANDILNGASKARFAAFAFYAFFAIIFATFFSQTMYENSQGIFTGGSQNLGDLPFHLGAIYSFIEGGNFPPQNPSFAGTKFTYPFIADLLTAVYMLFGADVRGALIVQNFAWCMSLLVIIRSFTTKLTGSKMAGKIAVILLFLSGGLGFLWFFSDYWRQAAPLTTFILELPRNYTIGEKFQWGNSLVVLFMTQRSLLLGLPLTLISLTWLWQVFSSGKESLASDVKAAAVIGALSGMLVLIHPHSLAALFIVSAFCLLIKPSIWKVLIIYGIATAIIALPELMWTMSGTATETAKFFGWHFGWAKADEENFMWFWLKNSGLFIPLLIGAGIWLFLQSRSVESKKAEQTAALAYFYIPFLALFIITNSFTLAPWEWDNIKVLIYWYVGSIPFVAWLLADVWERGLLFRIAVTGVLTGLCLSGSLDVWRTISGQNKIKVFEPDAIKIAELIRQKTPPDAVFLNAPTYNSAIALSGRLSFMRYPGHLASYGIDYGQREKDLRAIYSGGASADLLLRKNSIDLVLVSPEESRDDLTINSAFFQKYPLVAEFGQYRVYKTSDK